jgi:competence protein ComEC
MLPPLSWVALLFISGLVFADNSHIPLPTSLIITAITVAIWVGLSLMKKPRIWLVRKNQRIGLAPVIIFFSFLVGILRYQISSQPISQTGLPQYNDHGVATISGEICDYPDRRDTYQLLTVKAKRLLSLNGAVTDLPLSGRVIVRTGIDTLWAYGDSIKMTGRLVTPSDEADFSYKDFLAKRSIGSSLYYPEIIIITRGGGTPSIRWIYELRDKGLTILAKLYPMPESSLLSGILLGVDNGIPDSVQKAFRATGTTHIIAISGFNISILAALFSTLFYRLFGARKGALATILSLTIYVILTGASPSVIRAAIMGGLGLFASLVGRRQTGLNSLAFVAAAMCLANPFLPWEISFQLSFLSTLGLILFAEPMVSWLKQCFIRFLPARSLENVAEKIGEYCLFTLAALITTFPVMAFHFRSFSWSSLITNPLVLPAQPAVMVLGGLSVVLGLFWFPLGKLVAYLAWPFVAYTIRVVEWIGGLTDNVPGSLTIGFGFIFVYYLVLIFLMTNNKPAGVKRLLQPNLIIVIGLAVTAYAWRSGLSLPDGNLHIFLFENGPSENLLIKSPSGDNLLLNAGSKSSTLADALGKYLPPLECHLDYIFMPVSDKQAIRALSHGILNVGVENLVWLGDPSGKATVRDLQNNIEVHTISTSSERVGVEYLVASDISMVINDFKDASGGVFIIEWKNFRIAIPIHINDPSWLETVLASHPTWNYSVIILAGNGSVELNPPSLIKRMSPSLILVNSDPNDPGVLSDYAVRDSIILTTGRNGWIHLTTDGEQMWIEAARNPE